MIYNSNKYVDGKTTIINQAIQSKNKKDKKLLSLLLIIWVDNCSIIDVNVIWLLMLMLFDYWYWCIVIMLNVLLLYWMCFYWR